MRQNALKMDYSNRLPASMPGPKNPNATPVIINGIKYGCIKDAANDLGVDRHTLNKQIGIKGTVFDYSVYDSERRSKVNPNKRPVMVSGKEFVSLVEAAKSEGLPYDTLAKRFQRYNKTGNWPGGYGYLTTKEEK